MGKMLKTFEKAIILALLGLMILAVGFATVELVIIFVRELMNPTAIAAQHGQDA